MGRNRGFGERVKQAREYLGLKRRSLARRLGISPEMLEMRETGQIDQTDFGQDKLDRIADTLNRPLHFLVTGEQPPQKPVEVGTIGQRSVRQAAQLSFDCDGLLCPHCLQPAGKGMCDYCGRSTD